MAPTNESTEPMSLPSKAGQPVIFLPKKNVILDATILSTLMSCARLMDFKYNMNLVAVKGKSNSLEVGSVVHKVLEVTYRLRSQGYEMAKAIQHGLVAGELYAQGCPHCAGQPTGQKYECGHSGDEYPGIINSPVRSEGHYVGWQDAIETADQYFKFYHNDHWVTLEVERVKSEVLYEDDDIRILWKAKLDWIVDTNQDIYPVDHKTQKQRRQKIKLNNQFIGQCLVQGTRAMIVNNIGFQRSLKPEEKFTREMMSYSADALHEWQNEILPYWAYKLLEYTENGYFPPNFTHCENKFGNCPFIKVCESNRNMREDELRSSFMPGPVWNPTNEDE